MGSAGMNGVLRHVRRAVFRQGGAGLTDAQLLECFILRREEAAFTTLVRRHGPMVMGVCRRVLQNVEDAEDAFQATFLVLAHKAATIQPRDAVGAWLYGVACRTAKKAKAMTAKRRLKEQQFRESHQAAASPEDAWEELQPLLDEELSRLPEKYQSAIVLCDLEGKTKKEAASQLRCPEGTLSGWLMRGRRMLAKRLARRGVTLSAGALAVVLSQHAASASVRASLVVSTGKAATLFAAGQAAAAVAVSAKVAALAEGVLKAMLLTKLKIGIALLLVVGVLGAGVALQSYNTQAAEPGNAERAQPVRGAEPEKAPPQPGAQDEALKSQIAKVLKAHGGEESLKNLKGFTMRVNTTSPSERRELRFFIQDPAHARLEMRLEKLLDQQPTETHKMVYVRSGDKGWSKIDDRETKDAPKTRVAEAFKFIGPQALLMLNDPAMKVSLLGERKAGDDASLLGDRTAICIELARKDGKEWLPAIHHPGKAVKEVRLYFDKETGLLLKEEYDDSDHHEFFHSDYKMFNGIPVARRIVRRIGGDVSARSEVEFSLVDKLDAKLFERP